MIRGSGRRRLTCHHEAGHALARWYFGHITDRAVVLTVEDVRARKGVENRRGVLVECEGIVDGYDICGYPFGPFGVSIDAPQQAEILRLWAYSRDVELINCHAGVYAEADFRRRSVGDCMLAGGEGDMRHVRTILDAWGLNTDDCAAVAWAAETRASALVRSRIGSTAIKAIADALMERGEADGEEIAGLCRNAYGGRECPFGAWSSFWPPTLDQIRAGFIPETMAKAA